jgi:hypothetical protein
MNDPYFDNLFATDNLHFKYPPPPPSPAFLALL